MNSVPNLSKYDESQTKFLQDELILVDENDNNIGSISKLNGHLLSNKNKYPHRAFSIFLFDSKNRLLIQKRAQKKITFSMLWTNTCCSHPLNIESQNTPEKITNALVKRLEYELGIKTENNIYKLIDKILYRAPSNETYEEFEVDYLFMATLSGDSEDNNYIYGNENLKKIINRDEVDDIRFDTIENILNEIKTNPKEFTPWFKILMNSRGKLMDDILNGKIEYKGFDGKIKNHIE
jgi:isopentenyl-diphosphate delta-isomerase